MKSLRGIFSAIVLAVMLAPALAGEAPPSTEQTQAVEGLVTRAAVLIEKKGQEPFWNTFCILSGDREIDPFDVSQIAQTRAETVVIGKNVRMRAGR